MTLSAPGRREPCAPPSSFGRGHHSNRPFPLHCYRATYLDDQGRLDPHLVPNRDLFAGPYVGVALVR